MNKNINIPGRLHSVATDGQVAGANEIYDDEQQKFQGEINAKLHEEMEDTKEVVDSFDDRVKAIEDLAEISIEGGEVQVANTAEEIVAGSGKIPTANAVAPLKEDLLLGAVYDVSAKNPTAGPNNDGKFESLAALLSDANLNTLIPTSVRKGGMSIKFVQSFDNTYVQYRLMTDSFNTTLANWQREGGVYDFYQHSHKYGYEFMADVNNLLEPISTQVGFIKPDGTIDPQFNWTTNNYDVENYPFVFATGSQYETTTVYAALFDANDNLINVINVESGNHFNRYINCDGAKYLRVNGNNYYNSVTVCLPYSFAKVINLFGIGTHWNQVSTIDWKVGYTMYNTDTKLLRRCAITNGTGGVRMFETMPFQIDSIYVCGDTLYYYNGTELKAFGETIIQNAVQNTLNIEDNTTLEVATSLYGDSIDRIESADSLGIINANGTIDTGYRSWTIYKYDVSDFDLVYVTGKSSSVSAMCAIYDVNDNFIKAFDYGISGYIARNKPIIVRGAKYLRIEQFNSDGVPNAKKVRQYLPDSPTRNNLANKVVAFIGDSITACGNEQYPVNIAYHKVFADKYGCINRNLGVWSTCIAHDTNSEYASQYFATRATAQNLSDCALIVIFGGTNDFTYDKKPIGDLLIEESQTPTSSHMGNKKLVANSDVDCFSGALHNLINTIRTAAPSVPILFMTPLKKNRSGVSSIQFNAQGNTLQEFTNAIKTICEFYAIPVFDCGGMSELDFMNDDIATTYSGDGLHPNAAGHKLLGNLLFRFVEDNIYIE